MIKNTLLLALVHNSVLGMKTNEQIQQKAEESKSVASSMTDEDVKCYADRYPTDVNNTVDPRQHFDNIGKEQGRLSTCSRQLTAYESQKYLDRNPSLQRKLGRGGAGGPAQQLANQHFMEIGYKDPTFIQGRDEFSEPWFCGATEFTNCGCHGTLFMGPKLRPDNGEEIKTFDAMRYWKTMSKEVDDWTMCSSKGMGGDPWPEAAKQCWCEPAPQYEPTPCANEGEQCLCNGWVAYGVKNDPDDQTKTATIDIMTTVAFAINDANNTKSIQCTSSNFEMADPLPNGAKQCFCDEQKKFIQAEDVLQVKDYWRSTMVQMSMSVVMETASTIESKAESQISIVETTTASKETQEIKTESTEEGNTCASCEIEQAKQEEMKEKKKLDEERVEREKAETIEKEKAEREIQESIRRKKEAETLKAAAEQAESSRQKAMMEEESRRMKAEGDRLEAIAQIEREKVQREQEIRRQYEIRRLQTIEIERKRSEQITMEKQRQQEIVTRQRRAEIERTRVSQEKKLIEQKVEAEIVRQKSITQMEQSLVSSTSTIETQINVSRRNQRRHERRIRRQNRGTKKLEEIAEEEVKAVTTTYEKEKVQRNARMSTQYTVLNKVKEENSVVVQTKTKEATQHRRIKEEAMNSTIVLRRRMSEVQKSLLTTPACGATAGQSKQLENELKQIESEVETNTKIAELESKSESKTQKEADAANSKIFDQEKIVNKLVEDVSVINDKTEYAEAQREVILEQKKEEGLEQDVVKIEVEAFKANQSALAEESTLREMSSYSQIVTRQYVANQAAFGKKKVATQKTMSTKVQTIQKLQKELASAKAEEKAAIQKQITQLQTENDSDKAMLEGEENDLKEQDLKVKETEEQAKKQEEVSKKFEKIAADTEKKVSLAQDGILKNCAHQVEGKKAEQKKQEDKLEVDKKKLVEVESAEKIVIDKSKVTLGAADKAILEAKTELNKLRGQKNKLIEQRKSLQTKPEKQEIDSQIQALDGQAMAFMQTIDAEASKKKTESKTMALSHEKIQTQRLVVKSQSHVTKTAQELTAFSEMSCMSSTSVMISSSRASGMSSSSSTSTTTREYSTRVHHRIKELRDAAKEKRSIAQQAYQQFKVDFKTMKKRATDLKKQHDSYTMSLEEYKSAMDMFQMKQSELQNRMKSTQNDTVKAGYVAELEALKKEKEDTLKLIDQDKKDRKGINNQLQKVKQQIHTSRASVKSLRLEAKKAEDQVVQTIMSQTGPESVCEKKKIQAQQKQIMAEKNEKTVMEEKGSIGEKVTAMQLKLAAHELNQKESEEVIESLLKRKTSVEQDSSAGNQEQILNTIKGEIETEQGRAAEEKKNKETLDFEIKKLTAKVALDSRKAQTTKSEAKKAYDEAVESCEETASSEGTDEQENAFKQESVAKEEQKLAIIDEMSEMKAIAESSKKTEESTIARIEKEIKASEAKQTEAETIIDSLYKEIKTAKTQMAAPNSKSADIVQLQADIAAREKKIDDQKDIVRISNEEKRKAETEEKLIKDAIKEGEDEIANMTSQVKTIELESEGAKQQAIDYLKSQTKVDEEKVKNMGKQEIAAQKKLARLEKQLEETTEKTAKIQVEQIAAMQSLPAAEHAYALAQKQAKKTEEDSLITTCTKLYVEKKELFTSADSAMSGSSGSCGASPIQSCLGCGSGSTGVTQITVQISNKALIDSLIDGLFEKTLVADIEEVIATKKTSSVNGEKKTTAAPAGTKLVMVTSDERTAELLAVITEWSTANENAAGDVIATPFKYGKQDYFDFVKESTKKKEVDFEKQKQLQKQSAVQVSSFADADADSLPYNFSYVQMGKNEGVVSQLVKNISH